MKFMICEKLIAVLIGVPLVLSCNNEIKGTVTVGAATLNPTPTPETETPSEPLLEDPIGEAPAIETPTVEIPADHDGNPTSTPPEIPTPEPWSPEADTPSSLYDWVGIIGTGQSLSVGIASGPITFTGPSYNNLKLEDANLIYTAQGLNLSAVPLTEPLKPTSAAAYPNNVGGETLHGQMASTMTELSQSLVRRDLISAHSAVGISGMGMDQIEKAGSMRSFDGPIFEATAFKSLATAQNKTFGYGAVVLTHGETDSLLGGYSDRIVKMANDFNADLKAITLQTSDIPLLVSQQHTFPAVSNGYYFDMTSTQAQWLASLDEPSKVRLIGPKYQYSNASDGVHLTSAGYEDYGKKVAEVWLKPQA